MSSSRHLSALIADNMISTSGDPKAEDDHGKQNNFFWRFFAQFLASTIKNLFLFKMGLCLSLPTIVIAALRGISNEHNQHEMVKITNVQASWLSALLQLIQPVGCLLSIPITDPLGRKRSMILVTIPFTIGWYVLYRSSSHWEVFLGFGILGLGVGIMESPIMTYIGEICEPSFRGVLIGASFVYATIGMFSLLTANQMMAWRTVCLMCLTVPIFTAIALLFIPESPIWLLSKNRPAEAEKSLRWLRGWTTKEAVTKEFHDLQRHSERSKSCNECCKQNLECTHPLPTMREKLSELKRKRTLKPFFIVVSLFFLTQFTGIFPMKGFMVQIFKAYDCPIAADGAVTIMSLFDNLAHLTFIVLVRFVGKRRLYLFCISAVLVSSSVLSWYGFTYLPPGFSSFDQTNSSSVQQEQQQQFHSMHNKDLAFIPMISLMTWSYFSFCTISTMPWIFMSELFSFKSRGIASGISAAANYVFGFISKKTYYDLETHLSLPGLSLLYMFVCLFGLILTYNILPETEGRSLEEIELHFADNSKGLTDRQIANAKQTSENDHAENSV